VTSKSVSKFRTRPRPSLTSLGPIPALSASRPGSSNGAVSANSRVALPRPSLTSLGPSVPLYYGHGFSAASAATAFRYRPSPGLSPPRWDP
jgi:hypothetical protein